MRRTYFGLIAVAALFAFAVACTKTVEVPVVTEVIKEIEVEKVVT